MNLVVFLADESQALSVEPGVKLVDVMDGYAGFRSRNPVVVHQPVDRRCGPSKLDWCFYRQDR